MCHLPDNLELPLSYFSSYRALDVYFESDSSAEDYGFSIDYRAVDGRCAKRSFED